MKLLSRVRLLVTPWTAAYQAPPSMGFSRQEYWSGVPLPSPLVYPTPYIFAKEGRGLFNRRERQSVNCPRSQKVHMLMSMAEMLRH